MEMSATDYENSLAHYGILRKSGRYPWGSGKNPLQRSKTFMDTIKEHEREGLSEAEIVKLYQDVDKDGKRITSSFTVSDLRAKKAIAINLQKQDVIRQAQTLKDKGMGYSEIARRMSGPEKTYNESTIRSYLEPGRQDRLAELHETAAMLKRQVAEKGMIDIGAHVEHDLPIGDNPETRVGLSKDKFNTAVSMLKEEGYQVHTFKAPQVGTGEMTTYKVLIKGNPKLTFDQNQKVAWSNRENLRLISEKTLDGGKTWQELHFSKPISIDPKRIGVRYGKDGGTEADGVIYVRPGVPDVSMGKSQYAQVRVAVGNTHFLKGMAVYKNDLPPGIDLLFNTNKADTGNKLDAMKSMKQGPDGKVDWTNPFGAFPKIDGGQLKDKDGKVTSAMNLLNEQGDWNTWSRKLSSQVLSKQSPDLVKSQLQVTYDRHRQEFEEIKALQNPLIRRKLLETFSDSADSSAVHMKAANMPRQATKVLLPITSLKTSEVYAPTLSNGTRVSLVRFPHAGTFEIPQLTVNNRNKEAERLFTKKGTKEIHAPDVIGIHPKVAERLSGADFDGDHVVLVPHSPRTKLENSPPLQGLKGFDPQKYKVPLGPKTHAHPDGTPIILDKTKQTEMGKITNLISDMTIKGAKDDEIAKAVRHSMVVIDAEKHNLDYKASERDHGILALKRKYQAGISEKGNPTTGASTLLTRATSDQRSPKRKAAAAGPGVTRLSKVTVDNKTGKRVYELTGEINKNTGQPRTFRTQKLAERDDAFSLVSDHGGTRVENIYATHSNRMKALANEARLEAIHTHPLRKDSSATKAYNKEVESLKGKLNEAVRNAPHERQAQVLANKIIAQRRRANPSMTPSEKKKITGQALEAARARTGAKKARVDITDSEWNAIQAGALSIHQLQGILNNTDIDKLKERATPRDKPVMTTVMQNRAKQLRASGATYAEIADALGIPESTLQSSIGGR